MCREIYPKKTTEIDGFYYHNTQALFSTLATMMRLMSAMQDLAQRELFFACNY